jgi:periplasmic nitrate reductase NapE
MTTAWATHASLDLDQSAASAPSINWPHNESMDMNKASNDIAQARARELRLVFFLALVVLPLLTVAVVGSYGFVVWMLQLVFGPPGAS